MGTTDSADNSQSDDNQILLTAAAQKSDKHKKNKNKRKINKMKNHHQNLRH